MTTSRGQGEDTQRAQKACTLSDCIYRASSRQHCPGSEKNQNAIFIQEERSNRLSFVGNHMEVFVCIAAKAVMERDESWRSAAGMD